MKILVTGATGYIGGRLVPRLLDSGHEVRCMVRNPQKLSLYPWRDQVEVVAGDVLDERSVKDAMIGCDAAAYLVHSMAAGSDLPIRSSSFMRSKISTFASTAMPMVSTATRRPPIRATSPAVMRSGGSLPTVPPPSPRCRLR